MSSRVFERPQAAVRLVRRRRAWPWVLAVGLILGLAGAGFYVVRYTAVLGVKQVTVAGAAGAEADTVLAIVGVPTGTPLITVDTDVVVARITGQDSEVESATVQRRWPSTLAVTVVLRTAVVATSANGQWWLVDGHGVLFRTVAAPPASVLPIALATPGPKDPATLSAIAVVNSLPADIRRQVASIAATSPYAVTLTLADGRLVIWGASTRAAAKIAVFPVILLQSGHRYDISDPTLATVG